MQPKEVNSSAESRVPPKNNRTRGLKPFKKGQSGNPAGKKPGTKSFKTLYFEAIAMLAKKNGTTAESLHLEIIAKGAQMAHKGDYKFYKDVLDRVHGTATQNLDVKSDGEKIEGFTYVIPDEKK